MEKNIIWIFLFVGCLFWGTYLLGNGITGMVVDDLREPCSLDSECGNSNVCCRFYMQDYGVCALQSSCDSIYLLTKEELQKRSSAIALDQEFDSNFYDLMSSRISSEILPMESGKRSFVPSIVTGIVLIVCFFIILVSIKKKD